MAELVKQVPVQILAIHEDHAHAVKIPEGDVLVSQEFYDMLKQSYGPAGMRKQNELAAMFGLNVKVSNLLPIKLTKEQLEGANENAKNNGQSL